MVTDVLNAISTQLYTTFGNTYRYYVEDVEQNLTKPCFTIDTIIPLQRSKSPILYDRTMPMVIHYFTNDKKDTKTDCYAKAEEIVECLEYLPFKNTILRGEDISWQIVDEAIARLSLSEASKSLYTNEWLNGKVYQFYKTNFWDKMKLDKIDSQKIADEIFCFGCNAGIKTAIKLAQRVVNINDDGIIGENTLNALNSFDESEFDLAFDDLEMEYYDKLIAKNPKLAIYKKGWYNRANKIAPIINSLKSVT